MRISIWAFVAGILAAFTALASEVKWTGSTLEGNQCQVALSAQPSGNSLDITIFYLNSSNQWIIAHRENDVSMTDFSLVSSGEKRSLSQGRLSIVVHESRGELSFRVKSESRILGHFSGSINCRVRI